MGNGKGVFTKGDFSLITCDQHFCVRDHNFDRKIRRTKRGLSEPRHCKLDINLTAVAKLAFDLSRGQRSITPCDSASLGGKVTATPGRSSQRSFTSPSPCRGAMRIFDHIAGSYFGMNFSSHFPNITSFRTKDNIGPTFSAEFGFWGCKIPSLVKK